jgi:hypothetical protein
MAEDPIEAKRRKLEARARRADAGQDPESDPEANRMTPTPPPRVPDELQRLRDVALLQEALEGAMRASRRRLRRIAVPFLDPAGSSQGIAQQLNAMIEEKRSVGWTYSHLETIQGWSLPAGCFGGLFGAPPRMRFVQVAIFERDDEQGSG